MANLKEIRTRIQSVTTTMQTTSAMKMVSAARLRKAQDAVLQIRPYANKLHEILVNLSSSLDTNEDNPFAQKREPNKILIVTISSNRGLCGAFNSNVIKKAISLIDEKYASQLEKGHVDFISIGKKSQDLLKSKKYNVISNYNHVFDDLKFENVLPVAQAIMDSFISKEYDRIEIVYNHFKNAGVQILKSSQFLPIEDISEDEEESKTINSDYIFEPSKEYIVDVLIPRSLKIEIYKALLDSNASEHGARMTAMHKATDNASDLIKELQLNYNKARQASITNEILEIVGGAEALKG